MKRETKRENRDWEVREKMKNRIIYQVDSLYREPMQIVGYEFGEGEEALCIVGSMRGNEVQQLYICSRLIRQLKEMEQKEQLAAGKKILVIPCLNFYSMNIGNRFWSTDHSDINRMFPGYDKGETTQRIADGVFEKIKDYQYGVQFASFYMKGDFLPHIRIMKTGFEEIETAKKFGFPYIILRKPRPFDTTTLNYNWQIWGVKGFSIYTTTTERIDKGSAQEAVEGIFRLMWEEKISLYKPAGKRMDCSRILDDSNLISVRCQAAGICEQRVEVGEEVQKGQVLARILHPYEGEVLEVLTAPVDGKVFFLYSDPLVYADTAVVKLVN